MAKTVFSPSQSGSGLVENTLSVLVVCLISLGLIESAHWLLLRQVLNAALLDTARIAVTQHAHPAIIREAFLDQLTQRSSFYLKPEQRYWSIEHRTLAPISSPIRQSYQALQYLHGNPSIFNQNTLVLRLTYGHRPFTPLIRTLVRYSSNWQSQRHAALSQHGFIPLVTEVRLSMQSDPLLYQPALIEAPGLNLSSLSTSSPKPPLSSLIVSEKTSSQLLPWSPIPTVSNTTDSECDTSYCCGPLF